MKAALRLNYARLQELAGEQNSPDEIAARIGRPTVTVWRIRNGLVSPSGDVIADILQAFPEATFEELFVVGGATQNEEKES